MNLNPPDYLRSAKLSWDLADKVTAYYASRGHPEIKGYVVEETKPSKHYAVRINLKHNMQDLTAEVVDA